jgi:hypothetical protein
MSFECLILILASAAGASSRMRTVVLKLSSCDTAAAQPLRMRVRTRG